MAPRGARNCATLLSAAGHAEVPIGIGRPRPLSGNNAFPALMRWVVDRFLFVPPPPPSAGDPRRMAIGDDAVELLRRTIRGEERQVTVLAIGPLTTIAELIERDPETAGKIGRICVMGGALETEGNIRGIRFLSANRTAEWNIFCDPRAANIVFGSGIPVTLVPLDATNKVYLDSAFLKRLSSGQAAPLSRFIAAVLSRLRSRVESNAYFLWDVCAAAILKDPSLGVYRMSSVSVDESGRNAGRTRADDTAGGSVSVCVDIDRQRFIEHFFSVVTGK